MGRKGGMRGADGGTGATEFIARLEGMDLALINMGR